MNTSPRIVIVNFDNITSILHNLEDTRYFPTIDIDALLSIIIDLFSSNDCVKIENVIHDLMSSDCLSDRMDLDEAHSAKMESLIYNLLTIVQAELNQINLYVNKIMPYRYKSRRRNDNVLLERIE